MRRACRGQAVVEYAVLLAIVVALVAVPIGEAPSAVALLLDAVHLAWQRFVTALALAA